jgi:hypothetical protein
MGCFADQPATTSKLNAIHLMGSWQVAISCLLAHMMNIWLQFCVRKSQVPAACVCSSELMHVPALLLLLPSLQVFGSLEDSMMQLFTIMFGDVQFSTLKTIMNVNTVRGWQPAADAFAVLLLRSEPVAAWSLAACFWPDCSNTHSSTTASMELICNV